MLKFHNIKNHIKKYTERRDLELFTWLIVAVDARQQMFNINLFHGLNTSNSPAANHLIHSLLVCVMLLWSEMASFQSHSRSAVHNHINSASEISYMVNDAELMIHTVRQSINTESTCSY